MTDWQKMYQDFKAKEGVPDEQDIKQLEDLFTVLEQSGNVDQDTVYLQHKLKNDLSANLIKPELYYVKMLQIYCSKMNLSFEELDNLADKLTWENFNQPLTLIDNPNRPEDLFKGFDLDFDFYDDMSKEMLESPDEYSYGKVMKVSNNLEDLKEFNSSVAETLNELHGELTTKSTQDFDTEYMRLRFLSLQRNKLNFFNRVRD